MKKTTHISFVMIFVALMCFMSAGIYAQTWLDTPDIVGQNSDPTVNVRHSDHFRLRWGKNNVSGITVNEEFITTNLQNAERCWQIMHSPIVGDPNTSITLGFPSPSRNQNNVNDTNNYRANWACNQTWGNPNDGGAGGSTDGNWIATYGMGPWAMYPFVTTVPYHEYGHGVLIAMRGLNNGPDGMWHEGWANFQSEQTVNDLNPCNMLNNHNFFLPHGRDYYDSWVFLEHVRETPGFGPAFLATSMQGCQGSSGETVLNAMIRYDTSSTDHENAIKDLIAGYAFKNVTWDYQRGDLMRPYGQVRNMGDSQDGAYRWWATEMVKQPGSSTVYRVPYDQAPSQGGYDIVPIKLTGKTNGTGGYNVSVNFTPCWDGRRGSDWRACFVAVNDNGEPRYTTTWNTGTNTITLSGDENKLYLVVVAVPTFMTMSSVNQDGSHQQPYTISLLNTTATIQENVPSFSTTGMHQHANGGGWVSNNATVDSSAYVGPNAAVFDSAQIKNNARIEDYATVRGSAQVRDNAIVSGHAYVTDGAQIYNYGKVRDWATVYNNAQVYDYGRVLEHANFGGNAQCHEHATIKGRTLDDNVANVAGYAIKEGDCLNTANFDHGVLMDWVWGINQTKADNQPDIQGQYCGYNFETASQVFAKDYYGIIHGYLMGGCSRVKFSDTTRNYALSLNGTSQYVELRDDVNDFVDTTIAMWVDWTGTTNDQRIISFGNGTTKYMYLTPKDATTGNARFVITDGTTTQYLNATAPLTANRWTHVAVTLDGDTGKLYIDGAVVDTQPITLNPDQLRGANCLAGGQFNFIGRSPAGNYFQGYIDDFKIYSDVQKSGDAVISTLAGQFTNRTATTVAETDTTAPTPATAAWLISPTVQANGTSITMSATKGTDAGGNGVLYNFACTQGVNGHSSGWISSNKYTDNGLNPSTTYKYTVQMKDCLGNIGTVSTAATATTPAVDTTAPTLPSSTWAVAPVGTSDSTITMTANKGTDSNGMIEYQFARKLPSGTTIVTFNWQTSPSFTDTGLNAGDQYKYTVRMRDGKGNLAAISSASPIATAHDYTSPTVTSFTGAVWSGRPYAMTDNTFWMRARGASDTSGVKYYFHCSAINGVAQPDPCSLDSGWQDSTDFRSTTPVADGTYTWQYKVKDNSNQNNTSAYMGTIDCKVTAYTGYHAYTMPQIASVPDEYLVSFNGVVIRVNPTNYVVKDPNGTTTIPILPDTQNMATNSALLMKSVTVKGFLYTYSGTKTISNAYLTDNGTATTYNITGKVMTSGGTGIADATVYLSETANPSASSIKTATTDSSGNYSISVPNGTWYLAAGHPLYYTSADQTVTVNNANVPNVNFTLTGMPLISGRVTNQAGTPVSGATVCFSSTAGAVLHPTYTATTDSSGNYLKGVEPGTWYVAAYGSLYSPSSERTVLISSGTSAGNDFVVKAYATPSELVQLDAASLTAGNLTTWNNLGTLGGSFDDNGTTPVVETILGKQCVTFSGENMRSTFTTPAGITGNNNWSVACWAYNANIGGEECMVSWADRSGGSRCMQFNYGSASGWGAATHMSNDLGWAGAVAPTAGKWHHLVLTYAGGSNGLECVYVDGVLNNTANKTLNLFTDESVFLAAATTNSAGTTGWNYDGSLASVQIMDGVLTADQVKDLYLHSGVTTYDVSGTVTGTGGALLAGATVCFSRTPGAAALPDATATTDANGNYALSLPNGTWYMAAYASGYLTSTEVTTVVNSAAVTGVNFSLTAGPNSTITASAGPNGSISPSGAVSVAYNASRTFTMTPNTGYMVDTITVDGSPVTPAASYTFTNVTTNHTIAVTFKTDPYANLLLWYKLDETGGATAADSSNHLRTGSLNGGCTWTAGQINNCVSVNGTSGYVSMPDLGTLSSFTIATWINVTAYPTDFGGLFMTDTWVTGSLHCNLTSAGLFACGVNGWSTSPTSTTALGLGVWKHIAAVYDGSARTVKLYINGAQNASVTISSAIAANMNGIKFGSWGGTSRFVNGKFDDYRVYNKALSAAELVSLYQSGATFTITASAGTGGSISPSGSTVVSYGGSQVYTISANSGYAISQVTVDGVNQGAISSYTFTNVTAAHTISATFVATSKTITASAGANGSISPSGAVAVNSGANQTFTVTPNPGYGIASLKIDGANTTPAISYTFTNVTADHTIAVTFARPYAMGCRSVIKDANVPGRLITTWGKVKSINGTTSLVINDGYGDVTVMINGASLPVGLDTTKTVSVMGILGSDRKLQLQKVTAMLP